MTGALVGLAEGTTVVGMAEGSGPTLGEAVTKIGDGDTGDGVTGARVGLVEGTAVVGLAVGSGPALGEVVSRGTLGARNCAEAKTDSCANSKVSFIVVGGW